MSTQVSGANSNKPEALTNGSALADASVPKTSVANNRPTSAKKTSKTNTNKGIMQKSPEDLQEEVMELKKSMAALAEENTTLKAKARRVEEDNLRKNDELKRALSDKKSSSANAVVNNLKHKVFKLEQSLKEKDAVVRKLESDTQSSKVHEMKLQMDAYYREIIRLKNLNNLRETAKSTNEDSIQQVLVANKELEEENQTLRKDLERALAINRSHPRHEDYVSMSKTQLVGIITELENKLNLSTAEQKNFDAGDLSVDGLKSQLNQVHNENEQLRAELNKVKEDRLHYRNLTDNKDQELKALRLLIEHVQKQVESKPSSTGSGGGAAARKAQPAAAKRSPTEQSQTKTSGSVFDRLAQTSRSAQAGSPRNTPKQSGSSTGSDVETRKKPARPTTGQRVSPKSPKPPPPSAQTNAKEAPVNAKEAPVNTKEAPVNAKPSFPRAKALSPKSPKSSSAVQQSSRRDTSAKAPAAAEKRTGPPSRGKPMDAAKKKRPVSATKMQSQIQAQEIVSTSVSTTTYVVSQGALNTKSEPEVKEPISAESATSPTPANKSVTYTMLKTLNIRTEVPEAAAGSDKVEKKAAVISPPPRRANEQQIHDFRQNVAAKKIQKMWKHHQKETETQNRQRRVHDFRQNRAARTIQRGWKQHSQKRVVYHNPGDHVNGDLLIDLSSVDYPLPPAPERVSPVVAPSSPSVPPPNRTHPDGNDAGDDTF